MCNHEYEIFLSELITLYITYHVYFLSSVSNLSILEIILCNLNCKCLQIFRHQFNRSIIVFGICDHSVILALLISALIAVIACNGLHVAMTVSPNAIECEQPLAILQRCELQNYTIPLKMLST